MSEPKVLVLSVQPTYAFCKVNGKTHVERFTSPLTKDEVKARILERFRKDSVPVPVESIDSVSEIDQSKKLKR